MATDFIADVGGVSKSGIEKIVAKLLDDAVIYKVSDPDGRQAFVIAEPLLRHYIYRYKLLLD